MNKAFMLMLLAVSALFLCGCQQQKNPFVAEMSTAEFRSQARIAVTAESGRFLEEIPSAKDFPLTIIYSGPDNFEWKQGYYEKILVKNNEESWQEIFVAEKSQKMPANFRLKDVLGRIGQSNNSEKEFFTLEPKKGTLKNYSIDLGAEAIYFKMAIFNPAGEELLQATKVLYKPFPMQLKVFSQKGTELLDEISESDFPIKICYSWEGLAEWQYGEHYEEIILAPYDIANNVVFQGLPEYHDAEKGDDPRNQSKSDCVVIEAEKSPERMGYFKKTTEKNWQGFSTSYDTRIALGETISFKAAIHAQNTVLGEAEKIFSPSNANPSSEHKKDIVVQLQIDSALVQKIESNPANQGKSALEAILQNMEITIEGQKTSNYSVSADEITIRGIGLIPQGETKQIIISSRINGFEGKGVTIIVGSISQEDLDDGKKQIAELKEP